MKVLLDSAIVIDHLNGLEPATRYIRQCAGDAAVSVVTRAEVLVGVPPRARASVVRLLDSFANLPISPEIADLAAALRRKNRWKLPDAFQAAIARHHGLTLATRNTKDFPPSRHRFVAVPYRLPGGRPSLP